MTHLTPSIRVRPQPPVHVKPIRVRIQFNPRPRLRAHIDDRLLVQPCKPRVPAQPPRQMTEHVDIWVLRRTNDARRVVASFAEKPALGWPPRHPIPPTNHHRNPAVLENVHLGAGEQSEIIPSSASFWLIFLTSFSCSRRRAGSNPCA